MLCLYRHGLPAGDIATLLRQPLRRKDEQSICGGAWTQTAELLQLLAESRLNFRRDMLSPMREDLRPMNEAARIRKLQEKRGCTGSPAGFNVISRLFNRREVCAAGMASAQLLLAGHDLPAEGDPTR